MSMQSVVRHGYTSKTTESRLLEGNGADRFGCLGAKNTTLLCSIFLPVLVKAIPCIGKDLGMCTIANASLTVELQQDGCASKMTESRLFEELKQLSETSKITIISSGSPHTSHSFIHLCRLYAHYYSSEENNCSRRNRNNRVKTKDRLAAPNYIKLQITNHNKWSA